MMEGFDMMRMKRFLTVAAILSAMAVCGFYGIPSVLAQPAELSKADKALVVSLTAALNGHEEGHARYLVRNKGKPDIQAAINRLIKKDPDKFRKMKRNGGSMGLPPEHPVMVEIQKEIDALEPPEVGEGEGEGE